jgi:uncharacterized membrane protein HdeD (DUF308 family)
MTTTSPDNRASVATRLHRLVSRAVSPLLLLAGAVLLVAGVSMWSTAAAVVLAGVLLLVAGVLTIERRPADGEPRR